ncbi:citrate lyase subunit alpha [Peptoniphilus timonensis]|uniref:citrate lyase subunit alpha n=1 Tax=Peptoniphilus timonensis TaxID=1268254 RepID=UPI00030A6AEB|nr:citrate lyase subunit alpha [Peptoniphilus timonensis]
MRPRDLKIAREKFSKGEISEEELREVEDREKEKLVKKQKEAGLKIISDGEFRRFWWHYDFFWGLKGIEKYTLAEDELIHFHGETLRPDGVKIDVAFVGASSEDEFGNATGAYGKNVCGTLSYPMIDVQYATKSIVITDNLVPYPCEKWSVTQDNVDYVVVDEIGDASKIGVGAARISNRPLDLEISRQVIDVIKYSGYFKEGFSFQTGAGAIAIACTDFLRKEMEKEGIKASFALGGVTTYISEMLEEGLIQNVLAVQSFDANSAKVLFENQRMIEIDSGKYANPNLKGCSETWLMLVY